MRLGLDFSLQDEDGLRPEESKPPLEFGEVESATKLRLEDTLEFTLSGLIWFKGGDEPFPELELVSSLTEEAVKRPSRFFFS